jgi:hypothetical protein
MDFLPIITEYIEDIGYTPAFIALLGMVILIAAMKVIQVSRETARNSRLNGLLHEGDLSYNPIFEESTVIGKSLDKIQKDFMESIHEDEISISNLQENESIQIENIKLKNDQIIISEEVPQINDKISPPNLDFSVFQESQEDSDFELFTNPKHIFSGALKEIFLKKLKIVLNNMPVYRLTRFPFFKIENDKIIKFYLDDKPEFLIEELFELWRMGYKSDELPILFIHYFFSIKSDLAGKILKSILKQKLIPDEEVQNILFLYGNSLGIVDKTEYQVPSIENGYDAFIISDYIEKNKIKLNRILWQKWENEFFNQVNEDQKGRFFLFYFEKLKYNTSFILQYILLNKYKHILTREWREYVNKQAFFHGHYEKLNRLSFIPPEYTTLISRTPVISKMQITDLLRIIDEKEFGDLHTFLVLHINKLKDLKSFTISPESIQQYLERLKQPGIDNKYLPQSIRFLLFLYFYSKNDLNNMSLIMPYIKGNIGNFIPKLYQLRLIFKNQEYQRAYEEISNLWNNDEENMLLMNETAVYAYHAGKIEEAEELFSKLRELYPHNAQVLHNESIFLKFKSRMLSERHRKQRDNMQKKNSSV